MPRSLTIPAAYRFALGLYVAVSLYLRARHGLETFFLDSGALPWPLYWARAGDWTAWSVHGFAGRWPWAQTALFVLHGAAAMAFAVGLKPRLTWALITVLTVSLQHRNPFLLVGADAYMATALLWWPLIAGRAHAFWLTQVAAVYGFAAALKLGNAAWTEGSAFMLTLQDGFYGNNTLTGWVMGLGPSVLAAANYAALLLEALAPVALLASLRFKRLRPPIVALLCVFHLGIAFMFGIWQLSIICIIALLSLLWESGGAKGRTWYLAAALLAFSLALNLASLAPMLPVSRQISRWGFAAGLIQDWRLFSSVPHGSVRYALTDASGADRFPEWFHREIWVRRYLHHMARPGNRVFAAQLVRRFCDGRGPLKFESVSSAFGHTQERRTLLHYESCQGF